MQTFLCTFKDAKNIDFQKIRQFLKEKNISFKEHADLCGKEGIKFFKENLKNEERVLIIGCSPRTTQRQFQKILQEKGINKYLLEQVNIREQVAFVHKNPEEATKKAIELIKIGLRKAEMLKPIEEKKIEIFPSCLIIGGGVAGMQSSLEIANAGYKVYLIEKSNKLMGRVAKLSMTFPTLSCGICCMHNCKECRLTPKEEEVLSNENIEVFFNAEVENIDGFVGNYKVKLTSGEELTVGTIIIATGSKEFSAERVEEYGYGKFKDVLTSLDLEELEIKSRETDHKILTSRNTFPEKINFIQCVGSRDEKYNPYCSLVCCNYAIGQAIALKEMYPSAEIIVHYIDLRGPYKGFEEYYQQARGMGITFLRGKVFKIEEREGKLFLIAEVLDLGQRMEFESDLVILSIGQEPSASTKKLAKMLKLQIDKDGFFKDVNLMLNEENKNGVFVVGCAIGPKNIRYAVGDSLIKSDEVLEFLSQKYINANGIVANVEQEKCACCLTCLRVCPFNAPFINKDGKAEILIEKCTSCGICTIECPAKAIQLRNYEDDLLINSYVEGLAC